MFLEDVIAGALLIIAGFFFLLSLASFRRSAVGKLVLVMALLLVMAVKNGLVIMDVVHGTFGGVFSGYIHFIFDLIVLAALVAVKFSGREG